MNRYLKHELDIPQLIEKSHLMKRCEGKQKTMYYYPYHPVPESRAECLNRTEGMESQYNHRELQDLPEHEFQIIVEKHRIRNKVMNVYKV